MMHGAYGLDTLCRWDMQDGMSFGRQYAVSFDSFYEEYKERYQIIKRQREIIEELDTEIAVGELIDTIEYDYPNFHLSMDCFWCEVTHGELILKEAEDAKWLTKEHLADVEWLPADVTLIEKIGEAL